MVSPSPNSAVQAPRRRRRPPRSCEECRRRKVKCDRKEQCSHCILTHRMYLYSTGLVRTVAPLETPNPPPYSLTSDASPQQVPNTSPSRNLNIFQQPESRHSSTLVSSYKANSDRVNLSSTHPSGPALNKEHVLNELNRQFRTLEQLLSSCAPDGAIVRNRDPDPPRISDFKDVHPPRDKRVALNKSRLFGQTHWTNATHEFKKIAEFLSSETGNSADDETTRRLKSEIRALVQKCKLLAKSMKTSRPSSCFSYPEPSFLAKNSADQMTYFYISRFESAFRILHIPSFRTEYEQYWRNPAEAASMLKFKVQLVIAVGSSLYRESHNASMIRSAACQWVHAAKNWLSGPMEKDRLSISGLQVQCLLILARQVLSVSGDLIWLAMGTVLRTAMQLGLHRDPKHFKNMNLLQGEIRRRLWATVLEMNVQASLDSGVPPTLSFQDFDTDPPSNIDDKDIDNCTQVLKQYPKTTVTETSLQRFLFESLRSRLEVLHLMNGTCSEMTRDKVLALSSDISNACRECSNYVKEGNGAEGEIFRHNLADLFLRRFLLSLHRPLAVRAFTNPVFYFSRKSCLDSAMALLSPRPDEEFSHLILVGSGIFKNRIIHTSLALASELLIETEEQGVRSAMQGTSTYRKMLVDAVKEARRQLAQRIQLGETNVRMHMKLSIVLSQAECMEVGTSLQQQMAQSARDSLQMSYSAIQARSGSPATWLPGEADILTPRRADQQDISSGFDFNDILQTTDFVMDDAFNLGPPFC